jgi:putative spermidine/putrescine transport system ATP-binding protein
MVFQNYALFPHMTVGENLSFPLEVRGMGKSEREEKVRKALDMVQLGAFADRRPAQLSGGQAQRVAVARALVFDPDVVLMDEPLGALDKNLREQMQYEIKHIHENLEVTVMYVTHDQSEALTMSNRVAVFDDGVVQQLAPPDELYEQPLNAFVADFIGDNNRLRGTVMSADGKTCVVKADDGTEITALQVNIDGVGKRATLSLRPERVAVNPEPGQFQNIFQAKALELIYLGDHIRTRMSVCGHDDFIIKIPNSTLHAHLETGDTVNIGWSVDDCRALDSTD